MFVDFSAWFRLVISRYSTECLDQRWRKLNSQLQVKVNTQNIFKHNLYWSSKWYCMLNDTIDCCSMDISWWLFVRISRGMSQRHHITLATLWVIQMLGTGPNVEKVALWGILFLICVLWLHTKLIKTYFRTLVWIRHSFRIWTILFRKSRPWYRSRHDIINFGPWMLSFCSYKMNMTRELRARPRPTPIVTLRGSPCRWDFCLHSGRRQGDELVTHYCRSQISRCLNAVINYKFRAKLWC